MKKEPEKYTREWFVEMGRLGGQKTKDMYGRKHFKSMRSKVDNSKKNVKTPVKQGT